MTTTTNPYPNLVMPAGAVTVHDWDGIGTDDPTRYFQGPRAIVPTRHGDVTVWWGGLQRPDGSLEFEICVSELHSDKSLSVAAARQVVRAMMQAADEIERWSASD